MTSLITLRKSVALTFVALYLLIGVPLWYKLTTIYRASLPIEYIQDLYNNKFKEIHLTIPVFVKSDTYRFPDIHDAVQIQVNHLLRSKRQYVDWSLEIFPYNETIIDQATARGDDYHIVDLVLDEFVGYNLPYDSKTTIVYFDDTSVASNDLPFFIAQTLVEHTFELEWNHWSLKPDQNEPEQLANSDIAVNYNPNIHLSMSLLNGDGSPVAWEIDNTLKNIFTPFREMISPLVNFTVDAQIAYYNDLNLYQLNNVSNPTWHDLSHVIDLSELSTTNYFVEQNAINLVIVFPGKETNLDGLQFVNTNEENQWGSFIVPQWGVLIVNKSPLEDNALVTENYLNPIMLKFVKDLLRLLGVLDTKDKELSSPYIVIDSVKRIRIIDNLNKAVETLWSLIKLTHQFQQMAIPQEVLEDITNALDMRLELIDLLNNPHVGSNMDWNKALLMSNEIVKSCEKAFFHGEMLQQNFFPQEHKLAVYLPLLGPLSVVIFSGVKALFNEKKSESEEDITSKDEKKGLEEDIAEELKETKELGAIDDKDSISTPASTD